MGIQISGIKRSARNNRTILNEADGSYTEKGVKKTLAEELLGDHRYNFVKGGVKSLFCHCGGRVPRKAEFSAGRKLCFSAAGQRLQSGRILFVCANARREHNAKMRNGKFYTFLWLQNAIFHVNSQAWQVSRQTIKGFSFSCFISRRDTKSSFPWAFSDSLVSIVLDKSSGHLVYVTCYLNIAIRIGKKRQYMYNIKNFEHPISLCIGISNNL